MAALDRWPDLIAVANSDHAAPLVAAIRASGHPAGGVPIILFGLTHGGGQADAAIPPAAGAALAAALAPWRPAPIPAAHLRLEATFGADTIRRMAARFRDLLIAALAAADSDSRGEVAHRVAGVAGTLGFAELGAAWLAVSLDPAGIPATLRRDTRTTIAGLNRHVGGGAD